MQMIRALSSCSLTSVAGACNNVNVGDKVPGGPTSVATIQVQPMLPGRPSAAFDFTALGLMAKIIGNCSSSYVIERLVLQLRTFPRYRIASAGDPSSGRQEPDVGEWPEVLQLAGRN